MSGMDDAQARRRQILSALMDGEADAGEHDAVFRAWREDVGVRADWHAWQLIGDVLRREDLANAPSRDEALLRAVRARLADEPVVLAPPAAETVSDVAMPAPAVAVAGAAPGRPRLAAWARTHWQGPVAMAAGFVLVAGAMGLRHGASPEQVATVDRPARAEPVQTAAAPTREQVAPYVRAHWQVGGAPIQMPDAGLRTVSLTQPAR
jgi:sigma-E factor negative regulatory protein RseA